jgi:Predicted kinase
MLIVFGGLPGTGKSTVARLLAERLGAVWLRLDSLEQGFAKAGVVALHDIGPGGYYAAQAVALDNLNIGLTVVADMVNPFAVTRADWKNVAVSAGKKVIQVELFCSDPVEHRTRSENRTTDIPGFNLPTWIDIQNREYEPWPDADCRVDTAKASPDEVVELIMNTF